MKGLQFEELCNAVHLLCCQNNSTKTTAKVMYGIKKALDSISIVLILKNPNTDYLEIKQYYNVSRECANCFKRSIGTGLLGRLFYTQEFGIASREGNKDDYQELHLGLDYETALIARVAVDNRAAGVLVAYFDHSFDVSAPIRNFFLTAAMVISEAMHKERLCSMVNQLRQTDGDTGLLSHGFFMHQLAEELKRADRYKAPVSVTIMDVDNFKDVTNLYGLAVGRQLFGELAEELKFSLRGVDVLGLFGTDEFIVYMPQTPIEGAKIVLNRFRKRVQGNTFTPKEVETSMSIGLAARHPGEDLKGLVWRAQTALYQAKLLKRGSLHVIT